MAPSRRRRRGRCSSRRGRRPGSDPSDRPSGRSWCLRIGQPPAGPQQLRQPGPSPLSPGRGSTIGPHRDFSDGLGHSRGRRAQLRARRHLDDRRSAVGCSLQLRGSSDDRRLARGACIPERAPPCHADPAPGAGGEPPDSRLARRRVPADRRRLGRRQRPPPARSRPCASWWQGCCTRSPRRGQRVLDQRLTRSAGRRVVAVAGSGTVAVDERAFPDPADLGPLAPLIGEWEGDRGSDDAYVSAGPRGIVPLP